MDHLLGNCRQCGYPLFRLTVPRCPECGKPFDPDDPATLRFSRSRLDALLSRRSTLYTCLPAFISAVAIPIAEWMLIAGPWKYALLTLCSGVILATICLESARYSYRRLSFRFDRKDVSRGTPPRFPPET
jgi:hypothetical protein